VNVRAGVLAVLAATTVACHRKKPEPEPPSMLRGIISVAGTTFEQRVQIEVENRTTRLSASPADSAALVRLAGVEVETRGWLEERVMRVASFTAWSVSGARVVDGVVRVDGRDVFLETTTGRVSLGNPPAALRQMPGARVWVGGPVDKGPNTFGVIVPASR
jgi:hypothetical protein